MEETTWSVHEECKRLDRAGCETVEWEMSNNTYIVSAGKLWIVASTYPNSPDTALIHIVRGILQQALGLRVVCKCATTDSDAC